MPLSPSAQLWALSIAPKPPAALSFASSLYVIYSVISCPHRRRKVYHRIMVGMSFSNLLSAVAFFWGTWAIPSNFPVPMASGTEKTCSAQGFIIQLSFSVSWYYCSLSLFSFLAVKNDFDEAKLVRYEPWIHLGVLIVPFAMAIYGLCKHYYNPVGPWCWTSSFPLNCHKPGAPYECIHGEDIEPFIMTILAATFMFYAFSTTMMIAVYRVVKKRVKQTDMDGLVGKKLLIQRARMKKSRLVAWQAALYLAAFYSVYLFAIIARIIQWVSGKTSFPLLLLGIIMNSLQGFINMLVYVRLRIQPQKTSKQVVLSSTTIVSSYIERVNEREESSNANFHARSKIMCDQPVEDSQKLQDFEFSIFDGSNPSSQWAEFFEEDSQEEEENFFQEGFGNAAQEESSMKQKTHMK